MPIAMTGRSILQTWGGAAIAGVKTKGITFNGTPLDITSDDDAGWRKLLTVDGEQSINIDLDGVTKSQSLKSDFFTGGASRTRVMTLTYPSGGVLSGTFFLADLTEKGEYKGELTFTAKFQSSGICTWTPGGS